MRLSGDERAAADYFLEARILESEGARERLLVERALRVDPPAEIARLRACLAEAIALIAELRAQAAERKPCKPETRKTRRVA